MINSVDTLSLIFRNNIIINCFDIFFCNIKTLDVSVGVNSIKMNIRTQAPTGIQDSKFEKTNTRFGFPEPKRIFFRFIRTNAHTQSRTVEHNSIFRNTLLSVEGIIESALM